MPGGADRLVGRQARLAGVRRLGHQAQDVEHADAEQREVDQDEGDQRRADRGGVDR